MAPTVMSDMTRKPIPNLLRDRSEYTVAIVCALALEADAVHAAFDYRIPREAQVQKDIGDDNTYRFGVIGGHHVVVTQTGTGKVEATRATSHMSRSFPNIKICLLVGICGVVPNSMNIERLLGDVIMSSMLVQYDFGRQHQYTFESKDAAESSPGRPPPRLRSILADMKTKWGSRDLHERLERHLHELLLHEDMEDCQQPSRNDDQLFEADYYHRHHDSPCSACDKLQHCEEAATLPCNILGCAQTRLMSRPRINKLNELQAQLQQATGKIRAKRVDDLRIASRPYVHLGSIGVADTVMRSSTHRDLLARDRNVIAFEMESVGIWDIFPTIMIKGASDYADSHKNDDWQKYAAVSAAACAKAFLEIFDIPTNAKYKETSGYAAQAGAQFESGNDPYRTSSGDGGNQNMQTGTNIQGGD